MHVKLYKMRSLSVDKGKKAFVDLDLEFDGSRAFVIWDSVAWGKFELKARLEIDPKLLQKDGDRGCDFFYHGDLVLPRPEHN
jgi:hypothetical protein